MTEPCPICGMEFGRPYAGMPPCYQSSGISPDAAVAERRQYKDRGCIRYATTNNGELSNMDGERNV